jgi:predicted RNase H-related nuclease YkuK (DUF458 family)
MKKTFNYPDFQDWIWKNYDKKEVELFKFLKSNENKTFYIGTDSDASIKRYTPFTTVIVAHAGRGGCMVTHTDRVPYMDNLRQRLLMEAFRSLETAWFVDSIIQDKSLINIHLDVNSNLKYKSSKYRDELVGLIVAQEFNAHIKPYSWAATSVADKYCRKG